MPVCPLSQVLPVCSPGDHTQLEYTVLYYTVMYCTVLYYTVMYCTALHCTILYCNVLYCNATYNQELVFRPHCLNSSLYSGGHHTVFQYLCTVLCSVLYCTIIHSTVLYCTVLYLCWENLPESVTDWLVTGQVPGIVQCNNRLSITKLWI